MRVVDATKSLCGIMWGYLYASQNDEADRLRLVNSIAYSVDPDNLRNLIDMLEAAHSIVNRKNDSLQGEEADDE